MLGGNLESLLYGDVSVMGHEKNPPFIQMKRQLYIKLAVKIFNEQGMAYYQNVKSVIFVFLTFPYYACFQG